MHIMTEPKAIWENGGKQIIHYYTNKTNFIINSVITKLQNSFFLKTRIEMRFSRPK